MYVFKKFIIKTLNEYVKYINYRFRKVMLLKIKN